MRASLVAFGFLVAALFVFASDSAALISGGEIDISGSGADDLVFAGGGSHPLAVGFTRLVGGQPDIFVARSTDGGRTWNLPVNVSNDATRSDFPSLAVDGDRVYVAYTNFTGGAENQLKVVRSTNGGDTFFAPQTLGSTLGDLLPEIAASGARVAVNHLTDLGPSDTLSTFRSFDSGATFPFGSLVPIGSSEGSDILFVGDRLNVLNDTGSSVTIHEAVGSGPLSLVKTFTGTGATNARTVHLERAPFGNAIAFWDTTGNQLFSSKRGAGGVWPNHVRISDPADNITRPDYAIGGDLEVFFFLKAVAAGQHEPGMIIFDHEETIPADTIFLPDVARNVLDISGQITNDLIFATFRSASTVDPLETVLNTVSVNARPLVVGGPDPVIVDENVTRVRLVEQQQLVSFTLPSFDVRYTAIALLEKPAGLQVTSIPLYIAGDINGDGSSDYIDLLGAMRAHVGLVDPGLTVEAGDLDQDGDVDAADFLVWQQQFANLPPGSAAVIGQ